MFLRQPNQYELKQKHYTTSLATVTKASVFPYQMRPQGSATYRSCPYNNFLISMQKIILTGSQHLKSIQFDFDNKITARRPCGESN